MSFFSELDRQIRVRYGVPWWKYETIPGNVLTKAVPEIASRMLTERSMFEHHAELYPINHSLVIRSKDSE